MVGHGNRNKAQGVKYGDCVGYGNSPNFNSIIIDDETAQVCIVFMVQQFLLGFFFTSWLKKSNKVY